jgi:molecular chaperone DnaK (HSP70)
MPLRLFRDDRIDLINDPIDRARELYREQLDAAIEQLLPQSRIRPGIQALHDMGITLKDIKAYR